MVSKQLNSAKQLSAFYKGIVGKKIVQAESNQLQSILPNLFGYYLLQLGDAYPHEALSNSPILNHFYLNPDHLSMTSGTSLYGDYENLPFLNSSLDAVLLPHTLEMGCSAQLILQEAHRIVVPEGHLIVVGFNPWSLWGLWRLCHKKNQHFPWSSPFLSMSAVKRQLLKLDCLIKEEKSFFFRPPLESYQGLERLRFLEILGQYCWPWCGAVYVIVAKKRVTAMTPIAPLRRKARNYAVAKKLNEAS